MQLRGTPCCDVALRSNVEALRYSEPARRILVALGMPLRSLLRRGVARSSFSYGSIKNSEILGQ